MKNYLIVLFTVLVAGCVVPGVGDGGGPSGGSSVGLSGLKAFESCKALSEYLVPKDRATGGGSIPDGAMGGMPGSFDDSGSADGEAGGETAEPVASAEPATVEEADIVKQEGDRLYIVSGKDLLTYDITSPTSPERIGRLDLEFSPREIYVQETKVVIIGSRGYGLGTVVLVTDMADAPAPVTLRELNLDGNYKDSRMVGASVYLALQSWVDGDRSDVEERLTAYAPCDRVYVPSDLDPDENSSFFSWEIVGISLSNLSEEPEMVTVIGSYSSTVYATPEHFYLSNYFFEKESTGVYLFDLDPSKASVTPRANAIVPGTIVNQFSMDETNGVFRIVSTRAVGWWGLDDSPGETRNYLTTFRSVDSSLVRLGQIDTIVPGESVTAARFLGLKAFVATSIVQSDPLVAIDLSDPTEPRILSELHLPGMTTYIQQWNNYLIAIGSTNSDWWGGSVVLNLFDVSDPNNTLLVEQEEVEGGYSSEAQWEHRAFAFFEDKAILAIPVDTDTGSEMALYRVDETNGFDRLGAVNHDDLVTAEKEYSPTMRRALEEGGGNFLYTISEAGLKVSTFGDLSNDLFGEMFPGFL